MNNPTPDPREAKAKSRLNAAAPEMLAALKLALTCLKDMDCAISIQTSKMHADFTEAVGKSKAAIAKAEGGS